MATLDCCSVERNELSEPTSAMDGSRWRRWSTVGTTVAVVLLPKCPACWSIYAGLSSLLGLSFAVDSRILLPVTSVLLALASLALWLQARRGRGYAPFALASAAAVATLAGKFGLESDALTYAGLGGLLFASLWSSCRLRWPVRRAQPRRRPRHPQCIRSCSELTRDADAR